MLDNFFILLAPHHCLGCGRKGQVACANCLYEATSDSQNVCLRCGAPIIDHCQRCRLPFEKFWQASNREGLVKSLVDAYKFQSVRAAARPLAGILASCLPVLPQDTIIMPIPTIPKHIRQRGFDHTKLIAKRVARLKGCEYQELLRRKNNTVQFGNDAKTRRSQAKEAFACPTQLDPDTNYLIVDDVCTTGATVIEAAKLLKSAGAKHVWVAVIARQ